MSTKVFSTKVFGQLLATENISIQHRKISTAAFDLQRRILILPIWKKDLPESVLYMYLAHEVGHALNTPPVEWKNAVENAKCPKQYLNIVEDARIERNIKFRYPGLKHYFFDGNKILMSRHDIPDYNQMNCIDRINMWYKSCGLENVPFTKEEEVFIKRIDKAQSFGAAVKIAEDIYKYSKEHQETQKQEQENGGEDGQVEKGNVQNNDLDEDVDFDSDDYDSFDSSDDPFTDSSDSDNDNDYIGDDNYESDVDGDNDSEDDEGNKDEEVDFPAPKAKRPREESSSDLDSQTDQMWQDSQESAVDTEAVEDTYIKFGKYDYKPFVEDFVEVYGGLDKHFAECYYDEDRIRRFLKRSSKDFKNFREYMNPSVSYLAQQFEMKKRATLDKRILESKAGVIDVNKLYSYKINDDIFAKNLSVPKGKNHGLIFFLDWSSSMCRILSDTMKQLFLLVNFCKKVNIPFEVYAFTEYSFFKHGRRYPQMEDVMNVEVGNFCFQPRLKLMNILSSRMHHAEFLKSQEILLGFSSAAPRRGRSTRIFSHSFALSGTPLIPAVVIADDLINDFRKKNNLQIVNTVFLTDGESNSTVGSFDGFADQRGTSFDAHRSQKLISDIQPGRNKDYGSPSQVIFQDEETKKEYSFDHLRDVGTSINMFSFLVGILRDRTQSNILGFHIMARGTLSWMKAFLDIKTPKDMVEASSHELNDILKNIIKEQKFIATDRFGGFKEYYFISPNLTLEDVDEISDCKMSEEEREESFLKHSQSKVVNRVLLGRFIEHIV